MHPALTRFSDRDRREDRARRSLPARYTQSQVERAYRKSDWVRQWRRRCVGRRDPSVTERQLAHRIVREAKTAQGETFPISRRSLQLWWKAFNQPGPDGEILGVVALIDLRGNMEFAGDSESMEVGPGNVPAARSPEAVAYFYGLYHTQNRISVRVCHDSTLREARKKRWGWASSYAATLKWLQTHDNRAITCLMREGKDVWCRRYMPYLEIDYSRIEPGWMFQTDHHQCDFWVEQDGKQFRPWLTVVQDMRSRAIVGWNLGPTPHQDAILAAYLMAFGGWAIPQRIRIDNGKDFTSRLLTGVPKPTRDRLRRAYGPDWQNVLRRDANLIECVEPRFLGITAELGIEVVYAIPYAPWSKGVTERWFGTFEDRCGKTFATYCGRSAMTRPDYLEAMKRGYTNEQRRHLKKQYGREWTQVVTLKLVDQGAVPTMDQARTGIAEWIEEYHHTPHGAEDMAGHTPLEVWRTARSLRRAGDDELLFLMQARGVYKVGPNGVAFKIGGVKLRYGAGSPALYRWSGRSVFVTQDQSDLTACYAFTADRDNRRFIARLEANKRISPMASVEELREANASIGRRRRIMRKATREAAARSRSATEELNAKRRERMTELSGAATDGADAKATIVGVRTGFEGATEAAQSVFKPPPRDLSAAKSALRFGRGLSEQPHSRRRVSDDLLGFGRIERTVTALADDGNEEQSADTGAPRTNAFTLTEGSNQHDRDTD